MARQLDEDRRSPRRVEAREAACLKDEKPRAVEVGLERGALPYGGPHRRAVVDGKDAVHDGVEETEFVGSHRRSDVTRRVVEGVVLLPTLLLDPPHARAAIRVEVARARSGRPFLAAVEVDTDPHWHVYWRNPGDSGIPTTIDWHAPKGWRVEPLDYPTPRRFAPGGVAAYGYEGRTLFLARVTPSATPGALAANVRWLVCANACVPGSARVSASVPVGGKTVESRDAERLRTALRELPRPATGWSVRADRGARTIVLVATPPRGAGSEAKAEFFPSESGVIDHAKPAEATLKGGRFVFKMDVSPFPEPRTRLRGLLVVPGAPRALLVDPKLEPENKP